jgi:hypothetical protein
LKTMSDKKPQPVSSMELHLDATVLGLPIRPLAPEGL